MDGIKFLDCSLRDGGYRTNWHFAKDRVQSLIGLDSRLGIELIELGFLFPKRNPAYGPFSAVTNKLADLFETNGQQLGYMIEAKAAENFESFEAFSKFAVLEKESFSFVRIAASLGDKELSRELSLRALESGLDIYVNLMRASELRPSDVRDFFSQMPTGVKGFYLADSFGSLTPEQTENLVSELTNFSEVPVGFHAHNNRSMAFANVRSAVSAGATLIDGTWAGHGRGSGNARLEELVTEFVPESLTEESVFALGSHLERFEYDQEKLRDESSFAYHFGAYRGVHPNAVTALLDPKRGLSLGEMLQILLNQASLRNEEVGADSLLRENRKVIIGSSFSPHSSITGKTCILVGNAPGASEALLEVELAKSRSDVAVCVMNGAVDGMFYSPDLVFLMNGYREQQLLNDFRENPPAVISPLKKPLKYPGQWDSIPIAKTEKFAVQDSFLEIPIQTTLAFALAVLAFSGASEIVLVGMGSGLEEERQDEERKLLQLFSEDYQEVKIYELGQTNYGLAQAELW